MRLRLALLIAIVALAAAPSAGHAEPGHPVGGFTAQLLDSAGEPETRAGVAPDRMSMSLQFDVPAGNLKDLAFTLPPGFVGDADAVPTCPRYMLTFYGSGACPTESQVGTIAADINGFVFPAGLFNLEPGPGYVQELGFQTFFFTSRIHVKMLPSGQAQFEMYDVVQDVPLFALDVDVWGVPADHQTAPTAPRRALLRTATRCDGIAPVVTLRARTWQTPETWQTGSADMAPALVGCEGIDFDPQLSLSLDNTTTDSPTGAQVTVDIPQDTSPEGEVTARVKDIRMRFPDGLRLSPSAANGLTACSDEAARLGQPGPSACPASSKVGDAEIHSPLLKDPIQGTVYIGPQRSETDYQIYIVLNDRAIDIELGGTVHVDRETGQLTTEILDLPELSIDRIVLGFSGGPRALLATSENCTSGVAAVTLTSHSGGPPVSATAGIATTGDPFGQLCPTSPRFTPGFVAGSSHVRAGGPAPIAVTIRRRPGEQLLDRFSMTLPPGLGARLASVSRCTAARAGAGTCPSQSRIGVARVETGSGPNPFLLEGDAFLTGPYRRAPFGMALVFRAIAGPFDLGTVVIRAALRVDPLTAQVTIETDPLPQSVRGVPLHFQTIAIDIDRPGFMTSPTSCAPSAVVGRIASVDGAVLRPRSRFAVGGCHTLRFRPAIGIAFRDRRELRVDGHPGLRMSLRPPAHSANLRELTFELPELVEPSVTGATAICSRTQLEDRRCPAASAVGKVSGRTPLLARPMRGSIYSVQPPGNGLAEIWAVMRSTGVDVRFRMKTAVRDGHMRGRLIDLPDMPFSSLVMEFAGGKHGIFSLNRNPCGRGRARNMLARARMTAHSTATRRAAVRVRVGPGC